MLHHISCFFMVDANVINHACPLQPERWSSDAKRVQMNTMMITTTEHRDTTPTGRTWRLEANRTTTERKTTTRTTTTRRRRKRKKTMMTTTKRRAKRRKKGPSKRLLLRWLALSCTKAAEPGQRAERLEHAITKVQIVRSDGGFQWEVDHHSNQMRGSSP